MIYILNIMQHEHMRKRVRAMKTIAAVKKNKGEFIRVRVCEDLKAALTEAAYRDCRTETDEARFLLMKALGMLDGDRLSVNK